VSSLVDGVVREVLVELGQTVEHGDGLAYIDSREVGEAKLKLLQDQLHLRSVSRMSAWYTTIHENTGALLSALREQEVLDIIEAASQERPVGTYRQQLVSALARLRRAKADYERIRELGAKAIIPEKRVVHARAEYEAAEATYRALKEQIRFEVQQQALDAQQQLHAAEAAVAISRSHLLLLGYSDEDINTMDPIAEAGRVAYYPVRAPIAGTVIGKHAPLAQHVDGKNELITIADLSTVWLRANVYEKDLGAIRDLRGESVTFNVRSYPDRQFTADVFSVGDVVNDETRAAGLLAIVDNSERLFKPGMFVNIELISGDDPNVLQLPTSAIQRHAGATFVFVSGGHNRFERRDVSLGRSSAELIEVCAGLTEGEQVVVNGGFSLKSEMLSDLMEE
jgi:cobalt-zinc-cadmium efflux system membrane fusion protein